MIRRFVLPFAFVLWTCVLSLTAMTLHFLFLGFADPGFWISRRLWYPVLVALGRIRVEVSGAVDPSLEGPCVVVSNHQSNLDVPVLVRHLPFPVRFIAKRELYWIPFFGWYLYAAGYIAIDRKNHERSVRSMKRAGRVMRAKRVSVVVFAEGTRSDDGDVKAFKKGAFHLAIEAGVPILPVSIEGSYGVQSRHSPAVRPGTIRMRIHDPVPTEGLTAESVPALLEEVRARVLGGVLELRRGIPAAVSR